MDNLADQKILSHEEMLALAPHEIKHFLGELKSGWEFIETNKITKLFVFDDFVKAIDFVYKVADVAEKAGHHPDIAIHYNEVEIILWSHYIKGLSLNDFIIAARIDRI